MNTLTVQSSSDRFCPALPDRGSAAACPEARPVRSGGPMTVLRGRIVMSVCPVLAAAAISASPASGDPTVFALPAGALVVATGGSDANPGTLTQPLATIQRAVDLVQPGGTIAIRGGTYSLTTNIQILHSGTATAPIAMASFQGERVIIDGEPLPATP